MSAHCTKYKKAIAGDLSSCSDCDRKLHPSCVKHYLSYRTASPYCRMSLGSAMANAKSNNFGLPTSPFAQPPQPVTLDTIFAHLKDSDSRMSVFILSQMQVNNDLSQKLKDLSELIQAVNAHSSRISSLEQDNAYLKHEVSELTSIIARQPANSKAELVMSSFPSNVSDSPADLAKRVLAALGLNAPVHHVLGARAHVDKNAPGNAPRASTYLVVVLVSNSVCDIIINAKRSKRVLKASEVLGSPLTQPLSQAISSLMKCFHPHFTSFSVKLKSVLLELITKMSRCEMT